MRLSDWLILFLVLVLFPVNYVWISSELPQLDWFITGLIAGFSSTLEWILIALCTILVVGCFSVITGKDFDF